MSTPSQAPNTGTVPIKTPTAPAPHNPAPGTTPAPATPATTNHTTATPAPGGPTNQVTGATVAQARTDEANANKNANPTGGTTEDKEKEKNEQDKKQAEINDSPSNKNANPINLQTQGESGPTKSTGPVPAISPALNPNTNPIPEPVELDPQTLPALRNLVKHKYRGDAKAMFLKYTGESPENDMGLSDIKSMLSDSGLPRELVDDQADKVIKNYDGDKDERINIDEFDRLYSGN